MVYSKAIRDPIVLRKDSIGGYSFWHVLINNQKVAQLSTDYVNQIMAYNYLNGFVVSSVYVHTYEETVHSDENRLLENRNAQQYATNWTQASIDRGFIYLIDFSVFGKPA